jgi:hypothetical protein
MEVGQENRLQYCALVLRHYMQRLQKQPILTLLAGRIVCLRIVACVLPYYQHCSALITVPVVVATPPWDKGSEFLYPAHKHRKNGNPYIVVGTVTADSVYALYVLLLKT